MEWASSLIMPLIKVGLRNASLPDVHLGPFVGINLYLTQMYIQKIKFKSNFITFLPPNQVRIDINDLSGDLALHWRYHDGPLINWEGTALNLFNESSLTMTLELGTDGKGSPSLSVPNVGVDINDLDIQMHGDGGQFFQWIVNTIKPLVLKTIQKKISETAEQVLNTAFAQAMSKFSLTTPISNTTELWHGLVPSPTNYGLQGRKYSNNHFKGDGSPVWYNTELNGRIEIGAYDSFDISGYLQVPKSGQYALQFESNQRGRIDFNGDSAGKLEEWNIGMCWLGVNTHTTSMQVLDANKLYPLRVRYQSGCGGGHIDIRLCNAMNQCYNLNPMYVKTDQTQHEVPIIVFEDRLVVALEVQFQSLTSTATPPAVTHHPLSNDFPNNGYGTTPMISFKMDDYIFNTLFATKAVNNELSITLTDSMLPPIIPIRLNTRTFQIQIPDMYLKFPDAPMTLVLSPLTSTPLPSVSFTKANGVTITGELGYAWNVLPGNGTGAAIEVATGSFNFSTAITLSVTEFSDYSQNITGNMSTLSLDVNLFQKSFNGFDAITTELEFLFTKAADPVIKGLINGLLGKGIPIPVLQSVFHFNQTFITFDDGQMAAGTDFYIHL